jgi:hypothetical protein
MTTQPKCWRNAFFLLAVVAICLIGYLTLRLLDQSATLDYLRDGYQRGENALSVLRTTMPEALQGSKHDSQDGILAILRKNNPGSPIVVGKSTIDMDQIRFCFASDGSLERIDQTDDYGTLASDQPTNRDVIR